MSSTEQPIKHSSEGDAPDPKKVKLDEKQPEISDKTKTENNADVTEASKNDTGGSSKELKSSNGNDKERGREDDEDDEQDGDELTGEELDSDLEQFDPKVTRRLQSIDSIQQQISKLNELASEEILKVEQKFNKLRRPHFEQRNNLLKDVPNFWVTCLANHPSITHLIESAEDEDCLHYLVNLDVEELEDIKSGYNLKFHFKENPYIKNSLIVREIRHINSDEVVSKSTPVEYKDTPQGRSLKTIVENSVGQFTRSGDRVDQYSFFAWICLPCETGSDEIAELIKDQIWPSPLEFFFQTPVDDYEGNSDDDDEDEEDSDEEAFDEDFDNGVVARVPQEEMPEEDIEGEELDDDDGGEEDVDDDGDEVDDEEDEGE